MSLNFEELLDKNLSTVTMKPGSLLTGIVIDILDSHVIVHVGLKSEAAIAIQEFVNEKGEIDLKVGDEVQLLLEAIEDGHGNTRVSREKAIKQEVWKRIEDCLKGESTLKGLITGQVKGGMTVDIQGIKAFLPGSLAEATPIKDLDHLEGRYEEFKVIKLDKEKNNVVLSRRAVLEEVNSEEREKLLSNLTEGQEIQGVVKNLTDYGAFVDLGGLDGLLHITDISWSRVTNPSEVLSLGQEIDVKILSFDKEKLRVSLGLKQIQNDPWETIEGKYSVGGVYEATVSNLTDYGCFAELEQGVEGLIHLSELDWTNKNIHPSKVVDLEEKIKVMVLEIDHDKRRISLGLKQTKANPWTEFANKYGLGDAVEGNIKSVTDFGIFVGLEGDIDGLIHLSDITEDENPTEAMENFKKGDKLSCIIFGIDAERERISLKLSA
jgi:small subunit ribosomal protein S1